MMCPYDEAQCEYREGGAGSCIRSSSSAFDHQCYNAWLKPKRVAGMSMETTNRIEDYNMQIASLVAYIHTKITMKDWHAVQDAASDIRELDAKIEVLREL